ncbi:hypothetical protein COV20_05100 [Candidatus Woesearchaeota archaeon CG10_big_fil_rev_8_21_14_0_10_45_16]|nr:MAG: hypothetical protein COV20_05100 [Candidatus Woesearchaeota archaeon CG10_big_fil_rev_8_21_14_0_10_45_16]
MKMEWLIYALLGMLFFSGMILLFKKITLSGVTPATLMLFVAIFLTVFYTLHVVLTRSAAKVNGSVLVLIIIAAFLSYLANLFYTKSIAVAPNAGYPATIISLQLAVITIASVFLFGSELSLLKGTGIILAIVAGILLVI